MPDLDSLCTRSARRLCLIGWPIVAPARIVGVQGVVVNLSPDERAFLRRGLGEWWGPARCTDAFAVAMGFTSREHLHEDMTRLRDTLEAEQPLMPEDWRRLLLAVEVVFASDVVGSGLDWPTTTGFSDIESIGLLRGIQRKMPRWRPSFQFTVSEEGRAVISDPNRAAPDRRG